MGIYNDEGISLHFQYVENTETTSIRNDRTIEGEEAQYLDRVLTEFRWFLNSVGFTYVTNLVAFNEDGEEVAATEL